MPSTEFNFDGLIGPTHNYAGLSVGNLASQSHGGAVSNPRQAALQGLAKLKFLAGLGVKQAVLPPQERPDMATLRRLGFAGSDADILAAAHKESPPMLASCSSASSMWAANAATVSPSADAEDDRVHFTPANLASQFHRSLESETTGSILRAIFPDEARFAHHPPLPNHMRLGDEGAANHTRLCANHGTAGTEVFVYGRDGFSTNAPVPKRYPARQTRQASESIARLHRLNAESALFIQQNPSAIDAGAFHNDVVAVGNENVLLYHAEAWVDSQKPVDAIRDSLARTSGELVAIEVPSDAVSLSDAVRSYLFNSQLVSTEKGMALICPVECREVQASREFLDALLQQKTPIRAVHYVDLRQSMSNGGGPACLRLRVVLNDAEQAAIAKGVVLDETLYASLTAWVRRHYRDRLSPNDLADPKLLQESRAALDELTGILGLGSLYPFQQENA